MSLLRVAAAALTSALALWVASPAVGWGWVAWAALVPVALVTLRLPERRLGRLVVPLSYALYLELLLVPALPFGIADGQWGNPVLPIMVADSPVVFVALVGVPLAGLALYAVRFPTPFAARSALAAVSLPAAVWTALDSLRAKLDPSGLWGPLFLTQDDTAPGGLAVLAGPWLLTFAIVAVNWTLALLLVRGRAAFPAVGAVAAALAVALAASAALRPGHGAPITLAVVQPGYDTAEYDRPVLRNLRPQTRDVERASLDLIGDVASLTREAAVRGARIVVWPEATIWVDPHVNDDVGGELAGLARETRSALVVPFFLRDEKHGATAVVTPEGTVLVPQPKQRPMWFLGERGENRIAPRPAELDAGRIGTLLGIDNADPGVPRALAAAGAEVLASSTHDWRELAPYQRSLSRLHARATGLPLARADWRYGSALYDGDGAERASAGAEKRRAVLVGEVSLGTSRTPYARIGDVLAWVFVVGALGLVGGGALLRRRASAR